MAFEFDRSVAESQEWKSDRQREAAAVPRTRTLLANSSCSPSALFLHLDSIMLPHARDYRWKGYTRDGTIVEVCTAHSDSRERLAEHFASLSPTSLRFRFFGPRRRVSDREIFRFTEGDAEHLLTLIATVPAENPSRIVGVAQYAVTGHHADIACSVVDDHQRRGVGSLLLERVLEVARASGITEFDADLLESNTRALHLFEASGLARHRTVESGIVHLNFTSEEAERRLLDRATPGEGR